MAEKRVIRVMPGSFDVDWRGALKKAGVRIPENVAELRYTPVGHDPVPFALEIDAASGELVRRIVGVMPNALYGGRIYKWEEFCDMLGAGHGPAEDNTDEKKEGKI